MVLSYSKCPSCWRWYTNVWFIPARLAGYCSARCWPGAEEHERAAREAGPPPWETKVVDTQGSLW